MTKTHKWQGAVLIVAVLAVAGCSTATPVADPTSPAPFSSAPATPTATATPTPEPVVYDRIPTRVPLECDELLTDEQVSAALGIPSSEISPYDNPMSNGRMSLLQAGVLQCNWQSPTTVGMDAKYRLSVDVLADAKEEFAESDIDREHADLLGAGSFVRCSDQEIVRQCEGEFQVDGYWTTFSFGRELENSAEDKNHKPALALGKALRSALGEAGTPLAPYVIPGDALTAWDSCSILDANKKIRSALDSPKLVDPEAENWGDYNYMLTTLGFDRGGLTTCTWRQKNTLESPEGQVRQFTVQMIPGAGWAWDEARDFRLANDEKVELVDAEGADEAVISCSSEVNCTLAALVDGSYLEVVMSFDDDSDRSASEAAVEALEFAIDRLTD